MKYNITTNCKKLKNCIVHIHIKSLQSVCAKTSSFVLMYTHCDYETAVVINMNTNSMQPCGRYLKVRIKLKINSFSEKKVISLFRINRIAS